MGSIKYSLIFGFTFLLYFQGKCQPVEIISQHRISLADQEIVYKSTRSGKFRNALFINLHENESTSVEAARAALPGFSDFQLTELKFRNQRNLEFSTKGLNFSVDPNRIFTKKGAEASLRRNSDSLHPAALRSVNRHARKLLRRFVKKSQYVVALHNNTEENYSVSGYAPGGPDAGDVEQLYINDTMDRDNFFYTTDPGFFQFAADNKINVVLQKPGLVNDDGSLSVYCGLKGISYINIEAQHGHLDMQTRMTRLVLQYLQERNTIIDN